MAVQEVSGRLFSLFSFVRVPPPELVAYLHRRNYRSPFDFAQGRLSTHHPRTPPQRRRPVAGDPGTEKRSGPLSLRMTVHLFCNSLKVARLLPMNKGCEARVWRPARQPVWRPALLSEELFSLDVTCDASHDALNEQGQAVLETCRTAGLESGVTRSRAWKLALAGGRLR